MSSNTRQVSNIARARSAPGLLIAFGCAAGCIGDNQGPNPSEQRVVREAVDPTPVSVNVEPVGTVTECAVDSLSSPSVYGSKVKSLLTGMAMNDDELRQLRQAPDQFESMVDQWMAQPQFRVVLEQFFRTAFQQNEPDQDGLTTMLRRNNLNWGRFEDGRRVGLAELTLLNIEASFAKTALDLVDRGRPFTEVVTTKGLQVTTALLAIYTLLEHRFSSDQDRLVLRNRPELDEVVLYRNLEEAPPARESLNPSHPNFLHFYVPGFENLCLPDDARTFTVGPEAFGGRDIHWFIFSTMVGRPERVFNRAANEGVRGNPCQAGNEVAPPLLTRADFEDWRPVQFVDIVLGGQPTAYFDLETLRTTSRVQLNTTRVGFFTTLGFFSTWPTNIDNASRITINQTLITALGASFDGNTVSDFSPPNLDAEHSEPGTACFGCHQTLDPMRDFFRRSYSFAYGIQNNDALVSEMEPIFVFRGVHETGQGLNDLSRILAQHPDFGEAWVQKMCIFANGARCPEGSEVFQTIVRDFESNGFQFRSMLRSLLASPLVTNADCVESGTGGYTSISRSDQLCHQLSARMGLDNVCGEQIPVGSRNRTQRDLVAAMASIPRDSFARGEPDPVVITETGLFTRATREVVCTVVAEQAYSAVFGDMAPEPVLNLLVTRVMGLPESDVRYQEARQILTDHVTEAVESGASETVALQSALVVACMSPGMAGQGF